MFGNSVFQPTMAAGNGINVIIMIGDGMGWNMARAAALAKGAPFYTSGKGSVKVITLVHKSQSLHGI
ncbi:hypothetical protein [uncultured Nostoc sp.]|uniref:hypothetical protein n=1 Tax=uncultured Nostoc sp. TaxID=340711 RepID=UPI0035CC25F2